MRQFLFVIVLFLLWGGPVLAQLDPMRRCKDEDAAKMNEIFEDSEKINLERWSEQLFVGKWKVSWYGCRGEFSQWEASVKADEYGGFEIWSVGRIIVSYRWSDHSKGWVGWGPSGDVEPQKVRRLDDGNFLMESRWGKAFPAIDNYYFFEPATR